MSIKRYYCNKCKTEFRAYKTDNVTCACGSKDIKQLISCNINNKTTEKVDKYRGVNAKVDIDTEVKLRAKKSFYRELDDLIAEWGTTVARQQGWITKEGKKVSEEDFISGKHKNKT